MKHIRPFNESSSDFSDEVNDILNIARDEYECDDKIWMPGPLQSRLFRITNDFSDNDKFIRIVSNVLERLYEIGVVNEGGKNKYGNRDSTVIRITDGRTFFIKYYPDWRDMDIKIFQVIIQPQSKVNESLSSLEMFRAREEYSEINDILNIARDEYECKEKIWDNDHIFFKIYNDFKDKDKFIRIVRDVLDRLYDIDAVDDEHLDHTTIINADKYGKFKSDLRWDILHVNQCPNWYEDEFVIINNIRSVEIIIKKDI